MSVCLWLDQKHVLFLQPPIFAFEEDCWFPTAFPEGILAKKESTLHVGLAAVDVSDVFCRRSTQGCKTRVFAVTGTVAPLPIALHCLLQIVLILIVVYCSSPLICHRQGMTNDSRRGARHYTEGGAKYKQPVGGNHTSMAGGGATALASTAVGLVPLRCRFIPLFFLLCARTNG